MINYLAKMETIAGFEVVKMDKLRREHPEMFNTSGAMDFKKFEEEIRPNYFIYTREDVNSIAFTMQKEGVPGCTVEALITAAKYILEGKQQEVPSRSNALAITKLDEAIMWVKNDMPTKCENQTHDVFDFVDMQKYLEDVKRTKPDWGRGEWDSEVDFAVWLDGNTGLNCLIKRTPSIGIFCGYVAFDIQYKDLDLSECEVHGGITYDELNKAKRFRIVGFDCGHREDLMPFTINMFPRYPSENYRNFAFVKNECERLADYIAEKIRVQEK